MLIHVEERVSEDFARRWRKNWAILRIDFRFIMSRIREKDGTYVNEHVKELMKKALSLQSERSESSNSNMKEVNEHLFQEVMGKEHNGRVRGLGLGPTQTSFFGVRSYNIERIWKESTLRKANIEIESLKDQIQGFK